MIDFEKSPKVELFFKLRLFWHTKFKFGKLYEEKKSFKKSGF